MLQPDSIEYLAAPFLAWIVAQSAKYLVNKKEHKHEGYSAVRSGGMPSSHSAFMMSITTVIGLNYGLTSAMFGLALAVSLIIMYDSNGVRLTTGEQTDAIKNIAKKTDSKVSITQDSRGHYLPEVVWGAITGIVVGFVVNSIL